MDCIVPHHSVRMFCASIGTCAKIGKDLYLDFDPIDGLTLRALNDAKSAYVCFKYLPSFFERCTAPPLEILERGHRGKKRPRSTAATAATTTTAAGQPRDRGPPSSESVADEDDDNNDEDGRLTCRLSIKALAAAVRYRKHARSLRVYAEEVSSSLHLCFEYLLSAATTAASTMGSDTVDDGYPSSTSCWNVVHRVPVADFPVPIVSAVTSHDGASHMIVSPRVLCRLLEPLARHAETAIIIPSPTASEGGGVDSGKDQILATCFQQIGTTNTTSTMDNSTSLLLPSHLQTEMRLSFDDLVELEFVDDRDTDGNDEGNGDDMPRDVNASVALVFSHREAKALLLWSSGREMEHQQQTGGGGVPDIQMNFHWGGRPLIMEQRTDHWRVELVLATLDHKLLLGSSVMK